MSLLGISSAASHSAALPQVNFLGHARRKPSPGDIEGNVGGIGQIPTGAGQNLLSNALQALEQAIGSQAAKATSNAVTATGTSGASTAASASSTSPLGSANVKQDLQAFLHSLFQALKQDGLAGSAGASTAGTATPATSAASAASGAAAGAAAGAATASTGIGQYAGSLESSLQTLIQQLGSNGATTPAATNLTTAFNNLLQGLTGGSATRAPRARALPRVRP